MAGSSLRAGIPSERSKSGPEFCGSRSRAHTFDAAVGISDMPREMLVIIIGGRVLTAFAKGREILPPEHRTGGICGCERGAQMIGVKIGRQDGPPQCPCLRARLMGVWACDKILRSCDGPEDDFRSPQRDAREKVGPKDEAAHRHRSKTPDASIKFCA